MKNPFTSKFKTLLFAVVVAIVGLVSFSAFGDSAEGAAVSSILCPFIGLAAIKRSPDAPEGTGNKSDEEKLIDKIKSEVAAIVDGRIGTTPDRLKHIEKLLDGLKDYEDLKKEHIDLMATIKALKEQPAKQAGKSIRDQIKSQLTANAEKWAAFKKAEQKSFSIEIDMKAAATMLESTNLGGSAYLPAPEIVPGVVGIARTQALVEQYANTSSTDRSVITWVNKVDPEGNAAFTAEGGVKPLVDFNFETETSTARKVPAKIKVSTEMLDDIDFIAAEIENELRYQVDKAVDAGLLTGDGIAPNVKGITEYAGGFVLTTLLTTNANNADAIMAAATQVKSLEFEATHAFVNPIDAANMQLTKDSNGQYVIPPFQTADGMTIKGLRVVESNKITVGSVLVADMSKYVVRNYKSFTVQYGWVNDDFEKNLVTILGERRLHAYASDNNTGAFVYDTFSNIKTAITLP